MTRLAVILFLTLLLSQLASAKRLPSVKVDPVFYEGIRDVAPNDDGRRGYIVAWNVGTNKKLWELTVFTNRIDPNLEENVQWEFIKTLNIHSGWQAYGYIRTCKDLSGRCKHKSDHAI
jgi:hypothetical protein